ncbi:class I SAM-dependent methyltransferase [Foetidibacter luteolus]|uniref:class I SAM-dependent methyltransferase n=1 Tax=Foetidibacter luteolus TaxID=2608880 RepID=UPI00129A6D34|nr:class I SAM-dependent methyltransferase [Foetidibacter luteolus]
MIKWDTNLYDSKHSFVSKYGEDLIGWLTPQQGEHILDVGCGTGQLASEIQGYGADVIGMDASPEMIAKARETYNDIEFFVKDATDFSFDTRFDAVFSNATLHWISKQPEAIRCIYEALKPGGRFVFEMGGKQNIKSIADAVKKVIADDGLTSLLPETFWFFPSVAEYAALLENQGFTVDSALYFARETALTGDDGMKDWLKMFASFFFKKFNAAQTENILNRVVEYLRPTNYNNGTWYADYVRLRMKATKPPTS